MSNQASVPIVQMTGIVKRFGQTTALAGVDLAITEGEVHALVGENGAGKSTLMHILAGVVQADHGQISIRGIRAAIDSVEAANKLGVGMVHQHFMLLPSLTVAENLTLGREPKRRGGFFDRAAAAKAVVDLGERYDLHVNPNVRVSELSVGDLQRLEILRALYRGADILILDEPTGVLTPQETQGLFRVIRELKRDGKTTLFISHKLEEVIEIADTITVLRDGQVTGKPRPTMTDSQEIARLMVGRDVTMEFERPQIERGVPLLEVDNLCGKGVNGVTFNVYAHEIVGIAGVTGNGQTELADLIAGVIPVQAGAVKIVGQDVARYSVAKRRDAGLSYIPEDRNKQGLAPDGGISDNLLMGAHSRPPLIQRGILNRKAIRQRTERLIEKFSIKTKNADNAANTLSGGNAQRIVVAREMADNKPLIVAAQPTRGIDIAACEFVRDALVQRRNEGAGVLLISADLGEVMSISDRILVMYRGKIIGEVAGKDAREDKLGLLMAGITNVNATV